MVDHFTQTTGIAGSEVGSSRLILLIFLQSMRPKAPDFLLCSDWTQCYYESKSPTHGVLVLFLQLLPDKQSVHSSLAMTALRPSKHLVEKEIRAPLKEYTELSGDLSAEIDQQ